MEEENQGLTLSDIFRIIFTQKWLALIIAVVITAVGTLALYLGYGKSKTEYVSSFSVNISTDENGLFVYPNGVKSNYRDIISKENLNEIKSRNEAFSEIDVDGLYNDGNISLSRIKTETGENVYTLRAKMKAFSSKSVAVEFFEAIVKTPSRQIMNWVNKLSDFMQSSYDGKVGNEEKINYINEQLSMCSGRIGSLGGMPETVNEKIKSLQSDLKALMGELHTAYYEPDVNALMKYKHTIKQLEREREPVAAAYEAIEKLIKDGGAQSGLTIEITDKVASYVERIATLTQQIEENKNYLRPYLDIDSGEYVIPATINESEASKAFTAKMNNMLSELKSLISTYEVAYYENTSLISYDGVQMYADGGMGFVVSLAISLILGLLLAAVIAFIVGNSKLKAVKNKSAAPADAAGEAVLQAAATDERKESSDETDKK